MKRLLSILMSAIISLSLGIHITAEENTKTEYSQLFEKDKIIDIKINIDEADLADMRAYPQNEEYHSADITVDGILASDYPIADILISDDMTRYNKELDAWSNIIKILTFDNYIRVCATKSIDIDIDIVIKNDKTYIRPNDDDLKEATDEQNSADSE